MQPLAASAARSRRDAPQSASDKGLCCQLLQQTLSLMINGVCRLQQEEGLCCMASQQAAHFIHKERQKKKTQWAFDLRPEGVTCVASEVVKVNHEPPGSLPGFEDDLTQLPNCVITTSLDACWKTPFISFCYERSKDSFHYQNLIHSGR